MIDMKKLFSSKFFAALVVAGITLFTLSCEKQGTVVGTIPNVIDIQCNAGDRPSFTFTVEDNWQISSDATWCLFMTSASDMQDMSGGAGTHTINLKITSDGLRNEPTFANITMKMGNKSGIIARVERGANELYMRIYDVTDTPIKSIDLGYVAYIPFRVEANFRFAAVDYPHWVEFYGGSVTGVPGEQTESMARIVPDGDRERYPITIEDGYTVTFADESGKNTFTFPITFKGMGNDELTFQSPTESYFGWEVSLDGRIFRQQNEENNTVIKFEDNIAFTVTALNDDYEIVCFERVIDRGIPSYEPNVNWINIEKNKEEVLISVDPSNTQRYGMVMALPRATYNIIRADLKGSIFELDNNTGINLETIKASYQKFVMMEFTQKNINEQAPYAGMYAYHSLTICEIPCTEYTNAEVMEKYGVTDAFTAPFPNSVEGKKPGLIIEPRIEGWTTEAFEEGIATADVWYKDSRLKISDGDYYMGESMNEIMAIHLWGPAKQVFDDNVYIVFKVDGVAKKLLVVTPPVK